MTRLPALVAIPSRYVGLKKPPNLLPRHVEVWWKRLGSGSTGSTARKVLVLAQRFSI